jgi:4-amino-4-deoxy-L-arabinose transferase-like glycosyltransferase
MTATKTNVRILFLLFLLALGAVYVAGLFIDVTRDAAKYAFVSKEIVTGGSWLDLKIGGELYSQKPQLLFWLSAASFSLFGMSNFAFKFLVFLYSLLGVYAVYRLGRALYNNYIGKIAALMVLFSVVSVLYNMDIHTDIVLQTNIALSLWFLWEFLQQGRIKFVLLAGAAMGLVVLTKGPFGLMVLFFTVAGYIVATRRFKELLNVKWLLLFLTMLPVAAPAFIFYYRNWGWAGIEFFLFSNNFSRFSGSYAGHTPDLSFFVHNLAYLWLPWSGLFFCTLFVNIKKLIKNQFSKSDHFLFWGFWIVFIILSLSKSKLPNYILCLIPIIAVQTAQGWEAFFATRKANEKHWMHFVQLGVLILFWLVLIVALSYLFPLKSVWIILAIVLFALAVTYFSLKLNFPNRMLVHSLLVMVVAGWAMNFHISPFLFGNQAQVRAASIIAQQATAGDKVFHFSYNSILERKENDKKANEDKSFYQFMYESHKFYNFELAFYCSKPLIEIDALDSLLEIVAHGGAWIYTDEPSKELMQQMNFHADSIYQLRHFNLARIPIYLNPATRSETMEMKYLLYFGHEK